MTSKIEAALVGAGIALVSGSVGAFLQHFLSLRADRIRRERDRQEQQAGRERYQRDEEATRVRDRQTETEQSEIESAGREKERLREVLLESVSSRLATQDFEKFLEEVEKKHHEDGWSWAERPREALESWLRERQREAGREPPASEDNPKESSD